MSRLKESIKDIRKSSKKDKDRFLLIDNHGMYIEKQQEKL